jgi:hypothetical protein
MHDEYTPLRDTLGSAIACPPALDMHVHGFSPHDEHAGCFSCSDVWTCLLESNANAHLLHRLPLIAALQCAHFFCMFGRAHLGHLLHVAHGAQRAHLTRGGHIVGLHVGHLDVPIIGNAGILTCPTGIMFGNFLSSFGKHPHPVTYNITITKIIIAAIIIPCLVLHLTSPVLHAIKLYIDAR